MIGVSRICRWIDLRTKSVKLLLIAVLSMSTVYAQDSLQIESDLDKGIVLARLDSLTDTWFNQQRQLVSYRDSLHIIKRDSNVPRFSDSIIEQRLKDISTVIPMTFNKKVRSCIDLYTIQRREQVEIILGLSEYYFPIFEEVLDKYELPMELKYLPIIESALNPRAGSRVGARGLWQFMYGTGKMYKLGINSYVDERRDPLKSTETAARYLSDLYEIYKDWYLVIAAYNCGPGNVNKAIRRTGGKRNYWDIYYRLPRETRSYVPLFIAANYFMNYYKEHGLEPACVNFPIDTDTIQIHHKIHFNQINAYLKLPKETMSLLNPQYRRSIIPGSQDKSYALVLPRELVSQYIDYEDSIFAFKRSELIDRYDYTKAPVYHSYIPDAPGKDYGKLLYSVKSGDNLGYISEWYHVGLSQLKYWNNLRRNTIRVGQKLVVYIHNSKIDMYKDVDQLSFAEKQARIGKKENLSIARAEAPDYSKYVYYKVRSGDNLWEIAKKYEGISYQDIMNINRFSSRHTLKPGQLIKIKAKTM